MKNLQAHYDIVVIGGGIQGAGIALLARKAGYSVLLLEKNTWASGTSSKSSKLIHGGLRYLQTGQLKLVYECLRERQWMLKALPDLVKPNWFYLPVYRHSFYRPWKISLGLLLYRLLSFPSPYGKFKKIPCHQWEQLSGIKQDGLQAVFAYQDAQTDDAALTQKIIKGFISVAGNAMENTHCSSAEKIDSGYRLQLEQSQKQQPQQEPFTIDASIVVNATGPWINKTLSLLASSAKSLPIELVQGSHLVVTPQLSEQCFYLQAPQDNRAVFCLPWKGQTLIGTTEKIHKGTPETAEVNDDEVNYLCKVVKHYFPHYSYNIQSQFCGLRVLPHSEQHVFSRPRDTILTTNDKIISVYGGKLTGWRATAVKTLSIIDKLQAKRSSVDIDKIMS